MGGRESHGHGPRSPHSPTRPRDSGGTRKFEVLRAVEPDTRGDLHFHAGGGGTTVTEREERAGTMLAGANISSYLVGSRDPP